MEIIEREKALHRVVLTEILMIISANMPQKCSRLCQFNGKGEITEDFEWKETRSERSSHEGLNDLSMNESAPFREQRQDKAQEEHNHNITSYPKKASPSPI